VGLADRRGLIVGLDSKSISGGGRAFLGLLAALGPPDDPEATWAVAKLCDLFRDDLALELPSFFPGTVRVFAAGVPCPPCKGLDFLEEAASAWEGLEVPGGARVEGVLVRGLWEEAGALVGWHDGDTERSLGTVSLRPSL